jgi:hypothetical protein
MPAAENDGFSNPIIYWLGVMINQSASCQVPGNLRNGSFTVYYYWYIEFLLYA